MVEGTEAFGDFDENDALEDMDISPEQWARVQKLGEKFDEVLLIRDPVERRLAAKKLVSRLNNG